MIGRLGLLLTLRFPYEIGAFYLARGRVTDPREISLGMQDIEDLSTTTTSHCHSGCHQRLTEINWGLILSQTVRVPGRQLLTNVDSNRQTPTPKLPINPSTAVLTVPPAVSLSHSLSVGFPYHRQLCCFLPFSRLQQVFCGGSASELLNDHGNSVRDTRAVCGSTVATCLRPVSSSVIDIDRDFSIAMTPITLFYVHRGERPKLLSGSRYSVCRS